MTIRPPSHQIKPTTGTPFRQPGQNSGRQVVAIGACHLPQLAFWPALDLGNEASSMCADSGDHRRMSRYQDAHGRDKAIRKAFHLADFVDEIDASMRIWMK